MPDLASPEIIQCSVKWSHYYKYPLMQNDFGQFFSCAAEGLCSYWWMVMYGVNYSFDVNANGTSKLIMYKLLSYKTPSLIKLWLQ